MLFETLEPRHLAAFLSVALPSKGLRRLVGRYGVAPAGARLDALTPGALAQCLAASYAQDPELARAIDRAARKELGDSPLGDALGDEKAAERITSLVLDSPDPHRDLAWGLLSTGQPSLREMGIRVLDVIDEQLASAAKAGVDSPPPSGPISLEDESALEQLKVEVRQELQKEARRAEVERDRARSRLEGLQHRVTELESKLTETRRKLRARSAEAQRAVTEAEAIRAENEAVRSQLSASTAGELARLTGEVESTSRRLRSMESSLEESRISETRLRTRIRELEQAQPAPRREAPPEGVDNSSWCMPIFSEEFYDSIRGWDRRIVRVAFDKAHRLAEDWRHPSLRAIPLEGLDGYYRIRVATDVRLIYRPVEGHRVEILSLIDREDMHRYVRSRRKL